MKAITAFKHGVDVGSDYLQTLQTQAYQGKTGKRHKQSGSDWTRTCDQSVMGARFGF
jgi:hypothetical protein